MKVITSFLIILIYTDPLELAAQMVKHPLEDKDIQFLLDEENQTADIAFEAIDEIQNLLILITDKNGQTVFLDNKERFRGKYKKRIDLKSYGKGKYSIKIQSDNSEINKKFVIH